MATNKHTSTAPPQKLAYTLEHFAELLDVSSKTVRREIDAGVLPSVRIRGRVLITAAAGERYLAMQSARSDD